MRVTVETIFALIDAFGGHRKQTIELDITPTVSAVLNKLTCIYGDTFHKAIFDENETLKVLIFLNGRNVLALQGLNTELNEDDVLLFLVPIAGG